MANVRKEASAEAQQSIRMYRDRLAEIEEQWAATRGAARANLMHWVTTENLSLNYAAEISGNDRRVLKNWLDVWNAENKR